MSKIEALCWSSGYEIAANIRGGTLTASEVVESFLDRADAVEPLIHSFITIAADHARDRAEKIDHLPSAERRGGLIGVPFSAKDNILTAGVRTTMASRLLETFQPANDAAVVENLNAAGGVLLGKANLPEFSMWARSGNLVAQECRNPWDVRRTSGGSSGGSGAGVAAGLVPMSIGTDDGGSIRLPAALNGVLGLMPSPGRVPLDGVVIGGAVSAAGPLTRNVRDAALFLDAMMPNKEFDCGLDAGIKDLRMAWISDVEGIAINDLRVVDCARAGALVLAQVAGAAVEEPRTALIDSMGSAPVSPFAEWPTYGGLRPWHLPEIQRIVAEPGWEQLLAPNARAGGVSGVEAMPFDETAEQRRRRVVEQMGALLTRWEVLLTPTIDQIAPIVPKEWIYPYAAPEAGAGESVRQYVKYTMRANLAGCCAVSIPCGFVDGMPVGLQAIGRPGAELTLLRVARALEQALPWAHAHPVLSTSSSA